MRLWTLLLWKECLMLMRLSKETLELKKWIAHPQLSQGVVREVTPPVRRLSSEGTGGNAREGPVTFRWLQPDPAPFSWKGREGEVRRESGGKRKRRSELLLAAGRPGNLYKAHGQESGQQVFTSELRCGRSWVLWGKGGRRTSSSLRGRGMFSSPFVCWNLEYCVRDGEEKSRVRSFHF